MAGLAPSRERGRGRVSEGIEKLRASATRDGNGDSDGDAMEPGDSRGDCIGDDATLSFIGKASSLGEGVRGGGCPSEVSHASRAASSSKLASGSNWFRTSWDTFGGSSSGSPADAPSSPWIVDWSSSDGSGVCSGLSSSLASDLV